MYWPWPCLFSMLQRDMLGRVHYFTFPAIKSMLFTVILTAGWVTALLFYSHSMVGSWAFLRSTYGFMWVSLLSVIFCYNLYISTNICWLSFIMIRVKDLGALLFKIIIHCLICKWKPQVFWQIINIKQYWNIFYSIL